MGCCRSKDFVRRNAYKPEKQTPLADKSPEVTYFPTCFSWFPLISIFNHHISLMS